MKSSEYRFARANASLGEAWSRLGCIFGRSKAQAPSGHKMLRRHLPVCMYAALSTGSGAVVAHAVDVGLPLI
jgi:hypothetical protein